MEVFVQERVDDGNGYLGLGVGLGEGQEGQFVGVIDSLEVGDSIRRRSFLLDILGCRLSCFILF